MIRLFYILTIFFVQFTDKEESSTIALSPTAMEMRAERGIEIDSLDYAVSPIYLDSIRAIGGKILHTSRWMNGATVNAKNSHKSKFLQCSFVDTVYETRQQQLPGFHKDPPRKKMEVRLSDSIHYGQAQKQLEMYNLLPLHEAGFHGQGIRIGIADGGFANVDSLEAFAPVRSQWLGYTDFTDDTTDIFHKDNTHGALCLSTIVAVHDDYMGAATQAEYYLFRTEEPKTESIKELDNWIAAIEMADSLGLHIVSTSLGYSMFDDDNTDFTYADMNGRTSRGAKAATIAARKGMLLVVAMGNDGNNSWHYLSTPADADSILSVGATNTYKLIAPFSSYGPASDGRVKPEVCAVGSQTALIHPHSNKVSYSDGTSFACPLIAGMAACLWSALPNATNMEIRERIIQSADRYTEPNEQYGYGIPDAWMAYQQQTTAIPSTPLPENTPQKLLIEGQLWILHNGVLYNMMGQKKG